MIVVFAAHVQQVLYLLTRNQNLIKNDSYLYTAKVLTIFFNLTAGLTDFQTNFAGGGRLKAALRIHKENNHD